MTRRFWVTRLTRCLFSTATMASAEMGSSAPPVSRSGGCAACDETSILRSSRGRTSSWRCRSRRSTRRSRLVPRPVPDHMLVEFLADGRNCVFWYQVLQLIAIKSVEFARSTKFVTDCVMAIHGYTTVLSVLCCSLDTAASVGTDLL